MCFLINSKKWKLWFFFIPCHFFFCICSHNWGDLVEVEQKPKIRSNFSGWEINWSERKKDVIFVYISLFHSSLSPSLHLYHKHNISLYFNANLCLFLSLSITISISLSLSLSIYLYLSLSLSLSLKHTFLLIFFLLPLLPLS